MDDPLATKNDLIRLVRVVRWLVRGAAFLLALAFGWLKFRGVDLGPITRDLSADVIVQIALTLYYFCWVGGLLSDTSDQELVYVRAPSRPHVLFGGAVNAALLTAVFAVLCYVDSYQKFAVFLASFLVLNVIGWIYLIRVVLPPTVRGSEEYYLR